MIPNLDGLAWRKSSYSHTNGCVEVVRPTASDDLAWRKAAASSVNGCVEVVRAVTPERWLVRNSRDRNGAILSFTDEEMRAFILGVKAGEFDPEMWPSRAPTRPPCDRTVKA